MPHRPLSMLHRRVVPLVALIVTIASKCCECLVIHLLHPRSSLLQQYYDNGDASVCQSKSACYTTGSKMERRKLRDGLYTCRRAGMSSRDVGEQCGQLPDEAIKLRSLQASRRYFITSVSSAAAIFIGGVVANPMFHPRNVQAYVEPVEVTASGQQSTQASPILYVAEEKKPIAVDATAILQQAGNKAFKGGRAGATAALFQVTTLMWLRTIMNYQYRYGGDLSSALQTLWGQGGIPRLYQGLQFAIVQGPLTRFGDTAANVGMLALLESIDATASLPIPLRTACGSIAAGCWRIFLMPIDTSKVAMQVEGKDGLTRLWGKVINSESGAALTINPLPLYQGALASAAATAAGHFPWFLTYNALNDFLPAVGQEDVLLSLIRSAFLGLTASCVSDCCSNSLRVIKTTKQTAGLLSSNSLNSVDAQGVVDKGNKKEGDGTSLSIEMKTMGKATQPLSHTNGEITYREALALVLEKDGVSGLFGRGLKTRLLTNAIQGAAFSVLWKYFSTVQAS